MKRSASELGLRSLVDFSYVIVDRTGRVGDDLRIEYILFINPMHCPHEFLEKKLFPLNHFLT